MFTIAHRKIIDHVRARGRRAVPVAEVAETAELASANAATTATLPDEELWSSVAQLPDKQRTAVTLRFLIDSSYGEIAEVMGTSEEAARRNVHEALKRLRKELDSMNGTDDLERRLLRAGARLTPEPPDLPTAAAAAGMLDVAYATTDSPLGPLLLASTDHGLVRVAYLEFADRERFCSRSPTGCRHGCLRRRAGSTGRGVSSTTILAAAAGSSTCRSIGG